MSEIEICPLCESDLGHKIDCPLGSAWRDLRFKKCGEYIESLQQHIKQLEDIIDYLVLIYCPDRSFNDINKSAEENK